MSVGRCRKPDDSQGLELKMLPEQTVLVVTAQTVATVSPLQENYASRPKSYYQAGLLYVTVLVLTSGLNRGCP